MMSKSSKMSKEELTALREYRYRRTPERRIHTLEEAQSFVEEMGFCHFWPIKGIETPNLFHAIAGRVRDVPNAHDDPDLSKSWGWKDGALDKKWWYYGKLLRRRAMFVSLEYLPVFYAGSENFGDLMDYLDEYRDGLLSTEAKSIYEALLEHGPLDTVRLRKEARMSADSAKSRFDRALVELQVGLKVLPVGVAESGAWRYSFIYKIFQRHYPGIPEQARSIGRAEAQQKLAQKYLDNVIGTEHRMVSKIFHVMKWTPREMKQAIAALLERGNVQEVEVEGIQETVLVSSTSSSMM